MLKAQHRNGSVQATQPTKGQTRKLFLGGSVSTPNRKYKNMKKRLQKGER